MSGILERQSVVSKVQQNARTVWQQQQQQQSSSVDDVTSQQLTKRFDQLVVAARVSRRL